MKQFINAPILAEMIILSTLIADCTMSFKDVKYRLKKHKNNVLDARQDILSRVSNGNDKDEQIYDATDSFFDKYYFQYQDKAEIIYICRGALKSYLNMYAFGDSFYNLFLKLHKNSKVFSKKDFDISKEEKISFFRELKKLTTNAEMQIKN